MIFKHEYKDLNNYIVRGSDNRVWDKADELYLEFIQSNTPEKVSGDRFVIIVNGVVTVDPNKESILTAEAKEKADKEAEVLQKETDINTNLPTWQKVSDGIDGISSLIDGVSSLAEVKTVLNLILSLQRKTLRVVYWIAKNEKE